MRTWIALVGSVMLASSAAAQPVVHKDPTGAAASAFVDNQSGPARRRTPSGAPDVPNWMALGPFGGDVQDVAASPTSASIVLAGLAPSGSSGGSLYRSTDGGGTWAIVPSLSTISVYDIEFAPDGTAYVGTIDGVWRSTTGGATWTNLPLGIGLNDQVFDVAIDPTNPSVLWAGVADAIGGQPANVLKSTNGGATWTNVTPPLGAAQSGRAIAINRNNPQVVGAAFGGSFGGGQVWVTTDGGSSWQNRSAGLPSNPMNAIIHDGSRFILGGGQLFGGQNVGLFASTDLGVTWTPLHNGSWPTLVVHDVNVDPINPSRILVATVRGVFRSVDGGTLWQFGIGGTGPLSVNAVRFAPASSTVVYAGASSAGVYKSTTGGDTFVPSSTGIGALDVFSIAANPNNSSELAICFQGLNNGGVYRSTDAGQNWALQNVPGTRYSTVGFAFDGTLYAISSGPSSIAPEGLYRRNAGGTWTGIGPDQGALFESELFALRFSRNQPGLIMTAGSDFGVAGFEPTVWRTTSGGAPWTKVYEGPTTSHPVVDLEIAEDGTDMTMVASYLDFTGARMGGVLRSTDGGLSWGTSNTGLPALIQGSSLCPSPADPMTFFLSNSDNPFGGPQGGGVFRTTDGGASWAATGYALHAKVIDSDQTNAQVLYITQAASGSGDRVLRSQDGGATFSLFSDGLPASSGTSRWLAYAGGAAPRLLLATTTGSYGTALGEPCYADCDGTGTPPLNVNDFVCFQARFAAADPYADCDHSGGLNVNDFVCFQAAFAAGCP